MQDEREQQHQGCREVVGVRDRAAADVLEALPRGSAQIPAAVHEPGGGDDHDPVELVDLLHRIQHLDEQDEEHQVLRILRGQVPTGLRAVHRVRGADAHADDHDGDEPHFGRPSLELVGILRADEVQEHREAGDEDRHPQRQLDALAELFQADVRKARKQVQTPNRIEEQRPTETDGDQNEA